MHTYSMTSRGPTFALRSVVLALLAALALLACESSQKSAPQRENSSGPSQNGDGDSDVTPPSTIDEPGITIVPPATGDGDAGVPTSGLAVEPSQWSVTISQGQAIEPVQFQLFRDGILVESPQWVLQDADFGTISQTGVFTPSGDIGGTTMVHGYLGDRHASAPIEIHLATVQNGGVDNGSASSRGGYDGVGGEGPGPALSDAIRAILDGVPVFDPSLSVLYPYDETVFPLGLFSPLLMWSESSAGNAEGVLLHIHGDHFDYKGYFGRPVALANGEPFVRHPIPQDIWTAATQTVRGGELFVDITLAVGGQARGPLQMRFIIASGSLQGTVYYQSYGSSLIVNYSEEGVGGPYGASTLAIRPGEAEPRLIAGANNCRVCHSVSSQGQRLVTQGGNRPSSFTYDLENDNAQSAYTQEAVLAWIGLSPDGSLGLGNARPLDVPEVPQTELYDMTTGEVIPTNGLREFVTQGSFSAFSHNGTQVAFNFESGPGSAAIGPGDGYKLVTMQFNPTTFTFRDPKLAYSGALPPGWPSFSPDESSLVFQTEVKRAREYFQTRGGGEGQLWWSNLLTGESHPLTNLNGDGYLPTLPENGHEADEVLNFEPTVSPIATGGYAWVVFMSRRLYGNLATSDPYLSDPRRYDHTKIITTKKLWVAAIDLNLPDASGQSGAPADPSHPAFYLPGQELHAGNSRGFWVQDPCKEDGDSCETGVQCCTGVCQADLDTGLSTCGQKEPGCVAELDRCQFSEDCCDPTLQCINSICSQTEPVVVVR